MNAITVTITRMLHYNKELTVSTVVFKHRCQFEVYGLVSDAFLIDSSPTKILNSSCFY